MILEKKKQLPNKNCVEYGNDVNSVSFAPLRKDGMLLAVGLVNGKVYLQNESNAKASSMIYGHQGAVNKVSFSEDGRFLATASDDRTVKLWTVDEKELTTFKGHRAEVYDVSFSPDDRFLATASSDQTVRLWDITKRNILEHNITNVRLSNDGKWLVIGTDQGQVFLRNLQDKKHLTPEEFKTMKGNRPVSSISFSLDGKLLAVASEDGTVPVRLGNIEHETQEQEWPSLEDTVQSISFSTVDNLLATGSRNGKVCIWTLQGKLLKCENVGENPNQNPVYTLSFSAGGNYLAIGSYGGKVHLWEWRKQGQPKLLFNHNNDVHEVRYSPDGKLLASASKNGTVRLCLFEIKENQIDCQGEKKQIEVKDDKGNPVPVYRIGFSPNGQQIATASSNYDGIVYMWDVQGNLEKPTKIFEGEPKRVSSIQFSSDGQRLLIAYHDGTFKAWGLNATQSELIKEQLEQGCSWLKDYYKTDPKEQEDLKRICPDIDQ